MFVRIAGSRNKPLQIIADATAVGPSLNFAVLPVTRLSALQSTSGSTNATAVAADDHAAGIPPTASDDNASAGPASSSTLAVLSQGGVAGPSSTNSSSDGSAGLLLAEASAASRAASVTSTSSRTRAAKRSATASGKGSKYGGKAEPPPLEWTAAPAVLFDKVPVLQPQSRELRLRNTTLIDADVKLFIEGKDSVFEVCLLVLAACKNGGRPRESWHSSLLQAHSWSVDLYLLGVVFSFLHTSAAGHRCSLL